jgi:plastocyanin
MHTLAVQLAPVLAAEKSKVPFYIAGGALVVWALVLALVLGMRKPEFPGGLSGQRAVSAVSAVLVLGAVSTAVLTAGGSSAESAPATTSTGPTLREPGTTPSPASSAPAPQTPPPASTGAATTSKPAPPVRAVSNLALAAEPGGQLLYNTKTLTAKSGSVTIALTNNSPLEHNVTIAQGTKVLGATPTFKSGVRSLSLTLPRGTYTFYCSVPGHRQGGMEGTLTVQ